LVFPAAKAPGFLLEGTTERVVYDFTPLLLGWAFGYLPMSKLKPTSYLRFKLINLS